MNEFRLPSAKRRILLERAATEYAECVELALPYLTSRGLTEEIINGSQLGYVLDPLPGHERFIRYLSIPYVTPTGVSCIKFRCMAEHVCKDSGHPKYDGEQGSGTYLYGVTDFALDSRVMCVAEGELNKLSANVAGLPCVATGGANKWLPHWRYTFEGYDEVIVLQDGDTAGAKLGDSVSRECDNARIVNFPEGEDVNSYLVQHGADALRKKVLG